MRWIPSCVGGDIRDKGSFRHVLLRGAAVGDHLADRSDELAEQLGAGAGRRLVGMGLGPVEGQHQRDPGGDAIPRRASG